MPEQWEIVADRLAAQSIAGADPTGWFDRLYGSAAEGAVDMPWDREAPQPLLAQWAADRSLDGTGRSAVVVGCGLGADAEFLATREFATTAFDVSPTAIELARARHPDTAVDYQAANLLALPADWAHRFDLVVEIYTVQSLPRSVRAAAITAVSQLVADGGTLLVISGISEVPDEQGPPWPLTADEVQSFGQHGVHAVSVSVAPMPGDPTSRRWRAEFGRPRRPSGVAPPPRGTGDL